MTNEELVDLLDEIYSALAYLDSELEYYQNDEGEIVVTNGWHELMSTLQALDEVSPYLDVIQTLLAEEDIFLDEPEDD